MARSDFYQFDNWPQRLVVIEDFTVTPMAMYYMEERGVFGSVIGTKAIHSSKCDTGVGYTAVDLGKFRRIPDVINVARNAQSKLLHVHRIS